MIKMLWWKGIEKCGIPIPKFGSSGCKKVFSLCWPIDCTCVPVA